MFCESAPSEFASTKPSVYVWLSEVEATRISFRISICRDLRLMKP